MATSDHRTRIVGKCPPPLFITLGLSDKFLFSLVGTTNFLNQKVDKSHIDAKAQVPLGGKLPTKPLSPALWFCKAGLDS